MSGIYGIYRYDQAPAAADWVERMRAAMAYWGPHGGGSKADDSLALGHLLLETNPEDRFESQPMEAERGLIVSAARLDNREELLDTFRISSQDRAKTPDGRLVSLAFDRWGDELCTHLQGDWALAAWDRRERKLLLARDAFGNATLYYYQGQGFIAFASSLKALLALPGVKKEPDSLRLAQVLVSWQHDAELTAYKGFRRLVWAHALTVSIDGQARSRRYWSPEGRELLRYRRDEEYEEAFLEHYTQAVRSCLRSGKQVAAMVSGGRDSGSLTALAAPLLAQQGRELIAYTSVPCFPTDGAGDKRLGNEWEQAHATATMAGGNVRHVVVDAADYGVLQGIEHYLNLHDGPSHAAENQYWMKAIAETAVRDGAQVILTGQMGNATVSWTGNGSALQALLQKSPGEAWRRFLHAERNPWQTLKRQIVWPGLTPARRWRRLRKLHGESPWRQYSALNPHLARQLDMDGRMRTAGYDPTFTFSPLEDLRLRFFAPDRSIGAGFKSETGARHSVSILDPTNNLGLVEFLLRVPDSQFRRHGRACSLIRRTFRDRLPEPVLDGRLKGLQAADIGHRILREQSAVRQSLDRLGASAYAREMLDVPLLTRCLDDLVRKVEHDTRRRAGSILMRGLGVGLFLHGFD